MRCRLCDPCVVQATMEPAEHDESSQSELVKKQCVIIDELR